MKPYYLYDAASGECQGIYEAQESPLEPGVHIAPAHSTDLAPPECPANHAVMFADGAWSIVPDHRGETWHDRSTGEPTEITALGQPAEHFAPGLPAALQLAEAQAAQIQTFVLAHHLAIHQPVSYLSTTFQADLPSRDAVNRALLALNGNVPAGFYWVDADNNQVAMTFTQLQGLAAAMMAQGWAAFQRLQAKKAAVRAATSVEAVQAITW